MLKVASIERGHLDLAQAQVSAFYFARGLDAYAKCWFFLTIILSMSFHKIIDWIMGDKLESYLVTTQAS